MLIAGPCQRIINSFDWRQGIENLTLKPSVYVNWSLFSLKRKKFCFSQLYVTTWSWRAKPGINVQWDKNKHLWTATSCFTTAKKSLQICINKYFEHDHGYKNLTDIILSHTHTLPNIHTFKLRQNTREKRRSCSHTLLVCNIRAPFHMLLHVKTNSQKPTFISIHSASKKFSKP